MSGFNKTIKHNKQNEYNTARPRIIMIEPILLFNAILLTVVIIFGVTSILNADKYENNFILVTKAVVWTSLCVIGIISLFTVIILTNIPDADDVLKGKCVKQYIIEDGEVVDSCYIWKNI